MHSRREGEVIALGARHAAALLLLAPAIPACAQPDDPTWTSYLAHVAAASYALELNDGAAVRRWLDSAPQQHRNWEWRYLDALSDSSLNDARLDDRVRSLSISHDSTRAAACTSNGGVTIFSLPDLTPILTFQAHDKETFTARFSPDSTRIITASRDNTAKIWDAATGKELAVYAGHSYPVAAAAFTPDGSTAVTCSYEWLNQPTRRVEGVVHFWNAATGELIKTLRGGEKPLTCIAFSPDATHIACGSWDSYVFMWPVGADDTSKPRTFNVQEGPDSDSHIDAIAFSPDGALIAGVSREKWTRVWRVGTGERVAELSEHQQQVATVAFSPDGHTLATGGYDDNIRLYDTSTWTQRAILRGHAAGVRALAFTPDASRLVSAGADKSVRIWDPAAVNLQQLDIRHSSATYAVPWTPDASLVGSAGYDGTVTFYNSITGAISTSIRAHSEGPVCVTDVSSDGKRFATCSWDKSARIFDLASGAAGAVMHLDAGIACIAWSPDNAHVATALTNKTAQLWNADTAQLVRTYTGHEAGVSSVAFDASGTRLLTASADRTVRVWDVHTGALLTTMTGHLSAVQDAEFTPDASLVVSGSTDGSVRLWNAATGEQLRILHQSDQAINAVSISPDASRVAAASTRCLVLDVARGGVVLDFAPHNDTLWHLAFSPDGARLATCSWDGTIAIVDTRRRKRR
jgi:WD40 repeat protein